jgi:hypothetical protein
MLDKCGVCEWTIDNDQESRIGNSGLKYSRIFSSGLSDDASYKIGDKYRSVLMRYGKKLAMSRK